GGGRTGGGPPRRHGQGTNRGRGIAARAHRTLLDAGGRRAPLPRGAVPRSQRTRRRARAPRRGPPGPDVALHRRRRRDGRPHPRPRHSSPERARAPLDPRGRVPAPDRTNAGGRVTSVAYALRSYEFWLAYYRRVWRGSLVSSFVNPVLYLAALGIGLGTLVNKSASPPGGVTYSHYVAP